MPIIDLSQISGFPINLFNQVSVASRNVQRQIKQNTPLRNRLLTEGQVSGSGTSSSHAFTNNYTDLTVGTAVGLRRLSDSVCSLYVNAEAFYFFQTFRFSQGGEPNVIERVGYFDDGDGVFLRQNSAGISLELRSSTGFGSTEPIANWNGGNDFTNPLKPEYLDFTKAPIMFGTFQYLGEGNVKIYFLINSKPYLAHTFNFANTLDKPYWRTPNLFCRYEIEKTVAGGNARTLRAICSQTSSEGSTIVRGYPIPIESNVPKNLGTALQYRPLIIFRLNPLYLNSRIIIKSLLVATTANNANIIASIVRNPVLTGFTPTWTDYPNSSIQFQLLDAQTINMASPLPNEGSTILTDYGSSVSKVTSTESRENYYLSVNFANVPDIFALVSYTSTGNVNLEYRSVTLFEET